MTVGTGNESVKDRTTYIGSSDVGRILFGDALGVYAEKRNLIPLQPDNEWMRMGRRLERAIAEEYAERTGFAVEHNPPIIRHYNLPFLATHLDGIVTNALGERFVLEVKNVDRTKSHEWDEEEGLIPQSYLLQVLHSLYVCRSHWPEWDHADFAVLFGGNKFEIHGAQYDRELYEDLVLPRLVSFWQGNVLRGIPPEPDFEHKQAVELQKQLHSVVIDATNVLPATADVLNLVASQKYFKAMEELGKKMANKATAELLYLCGDAKVTPVGDTGIQLIRSYIGETVIQPSVRKAYTKLNVKVPKTFTLSDVSLTDPVRQLTDGEEE